MKKWLTWGAVGCLLLCFSTCDRSGPTMPFGPAASGSLAKSQTVERGDGIVVISSRGAYFIGETETFAASLMIGDGTIPISGGTWATDTPSVATVNDAGLVTIVGQGFANISCAYGGQKGSKEIWGRVDCRGVWSGTYSVRSCEIWKNFPDPRFCETHGGSGLPIDLVLTQEGEVLQGTLTWNGFSAPFVAMALLDGSLEMEGEVFADPYTINIAAGCSWEGSEPKFGMMLYYYVGDRFSGQAMLFCDISLKKTGAGR